MAEIKIVRLMNLTQSHQIILWERFEMGRRPKDGLVAKIEERMRARTVGGHAQYQATNWIALHGPKKAETIALLTLEKIRAIK